MRDDAQLLSADADARVAALDVSRSFIVQAPAGSGKTELLIQRYLKLLTRVENPEEILAITFTRKAAAEMHFRVLQALRLARSGVEPAEAHLRLTAAAASAVLARDRKLDWQLISNPGRMRIQTLDSLNASIARMQPMSAGSGVAQHSIVADAEMKSLYRNAAVLTLDHLTEPGPLEQATREILLHVDNNTSLYVAYVARMLATRDQWLPFVGSGLLGVNDDMELRARFENNLARAVRDCLARTQGSLPASLAPALLESAKHAAKQLKAVAKADQAIAALDDLSHAPGDLPEALPLWHGIAELLLTGQGQWRKTVTKSQGFPTGDSGQKKAMLDLLEDFSAHDEFRTLLHATRELPPLAYSDEQWSVLLALFRLLPIAVTELKRLFAERGVTDYTEVALSAADALGSADNPGDVALLLDYQLRHLLVDEMQDTSSAQYRMLESLTGGWEDGDGRTLFCVGDPMQSIYRFRNAEVGQFLLARNNGIANLNLEPLTLRRNFRSGENLVEWFNAVFPDVLAKQDDAVQSAVAYSAAVSIPELAAQGNCNIHPLFGSDTDSEAERGCDVIRDTLTEHPDDNVAILVRSRTHLSRLLVRLRAAGISYRAVEIDRLTDLPEIIDILALTRALVHRGDRLAWLAILRSPWAGLNWTDLHALVTGAGRATVWELMRDPDRLAGLTDYGRECCARLRDLLEPAMAPARVELLRDRIEKTWLSLGGAAILEDDHAVDNIYRYLDVIEQLEEGGTLPDVAELESALDLERVSSDSDARVQVMTMHRAKGLQFDHVLLFGLGRTPGRHDKAVLSWFDIPVEHGYDEKVVSPIGPRADINNDPIHRFIERVESDKFRNELGRLLYVACTRARKSLHLMGHVEISADGSDFRPARAGSLLDLLWPAVHANFERAFNADAQQPSTIQDSAWLMPALRRLDTPFELPVFPGIDRGTAIDTVEDAAAEVEFYWVGTEARIAGTLVHRCLQLITEQRMALDAGRLAELNPVLERWVNVMGISGESATTVLARVDRALRGILEDDKGCWLLEGEGAAELALTGVYDGDIESVVLDRVRIDEQGRHWIVDYKISSHEGGNLAAFLEAEILRYRPQMQKYAQIYQSFAATEASCALYFPLLQEFVEVPLSGIAS